MILNQLEIRPYDMETSDEIEVYVKGTSRHIFSVGLGFNKNVDLENEAYVKRIVESFNATCTNGGS